MKFKENVKMSFASATCDIENLKEWVMYLNEQLESIRNKPLVASSDAKKVHVQDCAFAKKIKEDKRVTVDRNLAIDQGFDACVCVA